MEDSDIMNTLKSYKKLCDDENSHAQLLMVIFYLKFMYYIRYTFHSQDKTVILYAATLLHDKNEDIINLCLDIFHSLVKNEASHSVILNTFGIFEAVESLSIR